MLTQFQLSPKLLKKKYTLPLALKLFLYLILARVESLCNEVLRRIKRIFATKVVKKQVIK